MNIFLRSLYILIFIKNIYTFDDSKSKDVSVFSLSTLFGEENLAKEKTSKDDKDKKSKNESKKSKKNSKNDDEESDEGAEDNSEEESNEGQEGIQSNLKN